MTPFGLPDNPPDAVNERREEQHLGRVPSIAGLLVAIALLVVLVPSPSSVAGRQASPGAPARASVTANRDGAALGPTTAHPGERSPSGPWPPTVTPPSAAVSRPTTPLPPVPPPLPSPLTGSYISISGSNLVYGGRVVTLRGENFNNEPALACCGGPNMARINVNGADYAQAGSVLGENVIRFGLDYAWYTSNRTTFYAVVDQHVAWAKANHLWMIPVMYQPPGGTNGGYGGQSGFWSSAANQQALINFWIDVAGHYQTEPTVAGWDVFNEPAPPSVAAYDAWAQHVYDAITATDPHHVVVLEVSSANWNLPSVNGNRILWSGHCYATVGTDGCNFPGNNHASPDKRPFFVGEVGSRPSQGTAYVPGNLIRFNQLGVSWTHFVMHEVGFGLYQTWGAGDFSSPWRAMIQAVQTAAAGSIKPT